MNKEDRVELESILIESMWELAIGLSLCKAVSFTTEDKKYANEKTQKITTLLRKMTDFQIKMIDAAENEK